MNLTRDFWELNMGLLTELNAGLCELNAGIFYDKFLERVKWKNRMAMCVSSSAKALFAEFP